MMTVPGEDGCDQLVDEGGDAALLMLAPGGAGRGREFWKGVQTLSASDVAGEAERMGFEYVATTTVYADTDRASCGSLDTAAVVSGTGYYAVASAQAMQSMFPGGGCCWCGQAGSSCGHGSGLREGALHQPPPLRGAALQQRPLPGGGEPRGGGHLPAHGERGVVPRARGQRERLRLQEPLRLRPPAGGLRQPLPRLLPGALPRRDPAAPRADVAVQPLSGPASSLHPEFGLRPSGGLIRMLFPRSPRCFHGRPRHGDDLPKEAGCDCRVRAGVRAPNGRRQSASLLGAPTTPHGICFGARGFLRLGPPAASDVACDSAGDNVPGPGFGRRRGERRGAAS
mmetsp:Transcript_113980/g.317071  ORF Transcript_113980/g.317071 Transcript_113980/m.317071 type:complete len:340 (+) Transcript_113980:2-1021(+)